MPADASVYGLQQPVKLNTPFENLSQVLQVRQQQQQIQSNQALEQERRAKLAEDAQKRKEEDAYYQILSGPGTTDDRLEAIRTNPLTAKFYAPTLKSKTDADKSAAETQKTIADAAKAQADAVGAMQSHQAGQAQKVIASDYNPAIFLGVAQHELELFPVMKGELAPAIAQVQGAPPEQQKAIVQQLMQGWGHSSAPMSNAMATTAKQTAEQPGQVATSQREQQVTAGMNGGPLTADQRGQLAIQQQNAATSQGQLNVSRGNLELAKRKFEQTIGSGLDEQGRPLPPEELARRAAADPIAQMIAEYRVPAISARSMQTPAGQALMSHVAQINPAYDASQFPARSKMRVQFTSGPQGQTLNSLNTAIEHLDQFNEAAKSLGNGPYQPVNALVNWAKTVGGDSAPTNFEGIKTIMAGELASAFKKSGATDQEIASVQSALKSKGSPAQLADYVSKIAIPALGSKAKTYQEQWAQTMGDKDTTFSAYTPSAKAVLAKYQAPPVAATPAGGTVDMVAPDGRPLKVPASDVARMLSLGAKRAGG